MRMIYKILMGMILFNSMLIMFSPFFPSTGLEEKASDTSTTYAEYEPTNPATLLGLIFSANAVAAMGVIGGISIIATLVSKSLVPLGVGAFAAIVTGMYIGASNIFLNLTDSPTVNGLVTIIGIMIGILTVFTAAEAVMGQQGVNT